MRSFGSSSLDPENPFPGISSKILAYVRLTAPPFLDCWVITLAGVSEMLVWQRNRDLVSGTSFSRRHDV
jgi:hypothetical protein